MSQESGFNPATRRLCPDGACIGVLDASGQCSECGRTFGADAIAAANSNSQTWAVVDAAEGEGNGQGDEPDLTDSFTAGGAAGALGGAGSEFDPTRRLCEDGSCVGVIGPNGACTVCGRMAR
jgi:hypothetical protein